MLNDMAMVRTTAEANHLLREADYVDLNKGRDFLAENRIYAVVVLHFLYRGGWCGVTRDRVERTIGQAVPELATSPKSSWGEWRRRLAGCGAQVIFAFGGGSEVSGEFLADVPGYERRVVEPESLTVFVRKEAA